MGGCCCLNLIDFLVVVVVVYIVDQRYFVNPRDRSFGIETKEPFGTRIEGVRIAFCFLELVVFLDYF